MKRILLVFSALMILATMAGCALDEVINPKGTQKEENQNQSAQVSQKPNIINAGIYDFDTFNPLLSKSESVKEAMQLVYEPLFTVDESMRTVPVLAKSVSVQDNGRTLIITLKDNVKWHDGSAFTAKDVAYTFKVILNNQTDYKDSLYNVRDYRMLDDFLFEIKLKNSVPNYENVLTFPIVKYKTSMQINKNYIPNGTGPFSYGQKASVDEFYFGAFDYYHNGRAKTDALYITMLDNEKEYMTMLESNEIDFSSDTVINLTEYMPKGNIKLYNYIKNELVIMGFNLNSTVFSSNLTRRGVSELIDKYDIVNSAIYSRGVPVDIPINPSSYLYYDTNVNFRSDELSANDFLGNDGWGIDSLGRYVKPDNNKTKILSFNILVNSDSDELMAVAENISKNLAIFNIETKIHAEPYDIYMGRINSKNYDAFIGEASLYSNNDISRLVRGDNFFGYDAKVLEGLCAQIGMTRDEEELKELYKQYGSLLLTDMPFTPLYYKKGSFISGGNVISGISPVDKFMYRNCVNWSVR